MVQKSSNMITSLDQLSMDGIYSYADYLTWRFEERVELIKGKIFKMSPAPSRKHQAVAMSLVRPISQYFRGNPCQAYFAPFDVRLIDSKKKKKKSNQEIHSVVQPDICVICDPEKLDDHGCMGAPDWIIEILSPGNNKKEVDDKFRLYEENGVREYWVVYPSEQHVLVFDLVDEKYQLRKIYTGEDAAPVGIFDDFEINLQEVFED